MHGRLSGQRRPPSAGAWLLVIALLACVAPARAAQPAGDQIAISQAGADGDAARRADNPSAAFSPVTATALVVWSADDQQNDKYEIFGRFVGSDGIPRGGEFRIGTAGPPGDAKWWARDARVAYNSVANEFLVVWTSEEPPVDGDFEIRGQRVGATGLLLGASSRLSSMGPGDAAFNAGQPQVVFNAQRNEYVVVWHGIDDARPGKTEVWARRVAGETGVARGADTRISSLRYASNWPTIALNATDNEYVVAWIGKNNPAAVSSQRTFVQRLTADLALVGGNRQVIQIGETHKPAVLHNPLVNEYLVAVAAVVGGDTEAYVQRLSAGGAEVGAGDARISRMGPDGAPDYGLLVDIALGYSPARREYVVAWSGDTTSFGLVRDENEVFGQALGDGAAQVGLDDFQISSMGPGGTPQFGVTRDQITGALAYAPDRDRFLAVWHGDNGPPQADNEVEVFGRLIGTTPLPPVAPVPPAPPGPKLMPDFSPLFATKARGRRQVRGYVYGISGLKSLPHGTIVTVRCESGCRMRRASFTVRTRGSKKRSSITFRRRVAINRHSRMRITARHEGYVSRYIRYRFVRKSFGITARRAGSGCQTFASPARRTPCVG